MKELRRKVIRDPYFYKGEKKESFKVIFDYRERNGALFETGARMSEIVGSKKRTDYLPGMRREDIDFENQTIKLWNSKLPPGEPPSFRIAYLSEFFRKALIEAGVKNLSANELVFHRGDYRKSWAIIKERAGVNSDFWKRDLRKCFTNNYDDAGVRESTVKYQINHASDDVLGKHYISKRPEEQKKTVQGIRDLL